MKCLAVCICKWTRSCHWACLLGFSKCLPGFGSSEREAVGLLQHFSVNAPLMICLKTFNIIIMLIRMETLRSLEMHSQVWLPCDLNTSWNCCSGPLKEGGSIPLLCVPLTVLLSDYFKDANNRRESNSGFHSEGPVASPPPRPPTTSQFYPPVCWTVLSRLAS